MCRPASASVVSIFPALHEGVQPCQEPVMTSGHEPHGAGVPGRQLAVSLELSSVASQHRVQQRTQAWQRCMHTLALNLNSGNN